jgi:hypothetical protein
MSAFFCSDAVFDKAVTAILMYVDKFDGIRTDRRTDIRDALPNEAQCRAGSLIGRRLKRLNRDAMEERYPGEHGVTKDDLHYQFQNYAYATPLELLRALDCLLYQCCEGKVPDSRRYKEIDRAMGTIAMSIVGQMPAYKRAPWGD